MRGSARILVAADHARGDRIAKELGAVGYDVSVVTVGPLVVKHLTDNREAPVHGGATDLLVLDAVERPWIGLALLEALRTAEWDLPVVLVAQRDSHVVDEVERLSAELFDAQQLFIASLGETVDRMLDARSTGISMES